MRSTVAALALAAGALAVPHKRDVVTHVDVVYETDVVTVWANAEPSSSVAVAAAEPEPTPSSSAAPVAHYGHNHWSNNHWSWNQQATSESASPSSTYVAPTTSTTPTSTYVPPAPTTTSTPSPPPPAPTTMSTSAPPPPPSSAYVAPTTSSTSAWVAPSSAWVAPSSSAAASAKPSGYNEIAVYHHNLHRANHSAPEIAWDDDLAASAQIIAASCKYAHNVEVNGGGYGQNIAAGVEPANISAIITDLFYNGEVGWYEGLYGQAQPDMTHFESWGHFSQIVWKDTTHVGCATQHCTGPKGLENVGEGVAPYFTVCNYKNPGNFANEYGKNVGQSLKQATVGWNAGM